MSAVAVPSQQQSASTPGFFSSAFLELNVFDQCFSSLTGDSVTTSDRKMNILSDSLASPKSIPLGHQSNGNDYSLGLSLPSPSLQEKRHSLHLPQSPIIAPPSYQTERRFSLPAGPQNFDTSLPTLDQFSERRWPHNQPSYAAFGRTPVPAWPDRDPAYITKSGISPTLQPANISHPTPPSSTHSDSPENNYNSDGVLQASMTPVESLSPLDTLITDNTVRVRGQYTPPSDSPAKNQRFSNSPPNSCNESYPQQKSIRSKRTVAKSGPSGSRKSKKNSSEGSLVEKEGDMNDQKRRKFLERNRVAASKCRQKKKQWMQELETNARKAQADSKHLHGMVSILREELLRLKGELLKHSSCGCEQISTYLLSEATKVAEGAHRSMTMLQQCPNQSTAATQLESQLQFSHSEIDDDDMLDMDEDEAELHEPPGGRESSGHSG